MKKYIYIVLILTTTLYTSCTKDYLDVIPDNVATIDNAFSSKYTAQKFLYTLYSALPAPGNVNNPALNGADEIWYSSNGINRTGPRIAQGFQNANSPYYNKWTGQSNNDLYVAIRNCNIFINRIDGVLGMDEYERKQWKAEAIFLKAYYHFYLLQMYGPVVINDVDVPVSASTSDVKVVRSTVDECFTYVIDLLDKSMVDLPVALQNPDLETGRITRPIAAAIKARVMITYASPLFNGNTVYNGFVNAEGVNFFPQQYDVTKWEKAAIAAKEAIDICQQAGYRLIQKADYSNPKELNDATLLRTALRLRVTEKWNPEIIWGHTDGTYRLEQDAMPRLYSKTGNPVTSMHCPPIGIAEMYYSKNGVPIEEDINYDYANRFKTRESGENDRYDVSLTEISGTVKSSTAILNYDRENRFYADLGFDRGLWFGNGSDTDLFNNPTPAQDFSWVLLGKTGEAAGVHESKESSVTGYWAKKVIGLGSQINSDATSFSAKQYSFPIIRLADLYLYYAEALNEAKAAPDAAVYQYIDLVRQRSGLGTVVDSWAQFSNNPAKPLSKSGMRDIIRQERLIELSFEGSRFWDLRRWKLTKKYMNKPIKGWSVNESTKANYYTVRTLFTPTFDEKDYLWPIPDDEIIKNPSLIQNPGW
jgi:hypothetical protein